MYTHTSQVQIEALCVSTVQNRKNITTLDLGSTISFCNSYFEMFSTFHCWQLGVFLAGSRSHFTALPKSLLTLGWDSKWLKKKIIPALTCMSHCWILVSCKALWVSHIQTRGTAAAILYIALGPTKEIAGIGRKVGRRGQIPSTLQLSRQTIFLLQPIHILSCWTSMRKKLQNDGTQKKKGDELPWPCHAIHLQLFLIDLFLATI